MEQVTDRFANMIPYRCFHTVQQELTRANAQLAKKDAELDKAIDIIKNQQESIAEYRQVVDKLLVIANRVIEDSEQGEAVTEAYRIINNNCNY